MKKILIILGMVFSVIFLFGSIWVYRNLQEHSSIKEVEQTSEDKEISDGLDKNIPAPDKPVEGSNGFAAPEGPYIFKTGEFTKIDAIHYASGEAQFINSSEKLYLKLVNFESAQGPDLYIYLSKNSDVKKDGLGEYVSLGSLKSIKGDQTYDLPENASDYKSVVIWCRAFSTLFSSASLGEVLY